MNVIIQISIQTSTKATHINSGKHAGASIKTQLNMLQLSIGKAPGWNALMVMIAIESKTPGHDMQPNSIRVILFFNLSM